MYTKPELDKGGVGMKADCAPSLKMRKYEKKLDLQKRKLAKKLFLKSK